MHYAESIVSLIETSLQSLTGITVYRGKSTPIEFENLPAVNIMSGDEEQADSGTLTQYHFILTVDIECYAADSETKNIETALNEVKEEVTKKLHEKASIHSSVIEMNETGSTKPEIYDGGERQITQQTVGFAYLYRRSRLDPGA